MRCSNIRFKHDGTKLKPFDYVTLINVLREELSTAGFRTNVDLLPPKIPATMDQLDPRSIIRNIRNASKPKAEKLQTFQLKIGLHMCSFRINSIIHGYNARIDSSHHQKTIKGYKRTDIPTWEQRESFNHIVNNVFDRYVINATIVSGAFKVRDSREGRIDSWYCTGALSEIIPEKRAREICDSDEKEKTARLQRNANTRKRRADFKAAQALISNTQKPVME